MCTIGSGVGGGVGVGVGVGFGSTVGVGVAVTAPMNPPTAATAAPHRVDVRILGHSERAISIIATGKDPVNQSTGLSISAGDTINTSQGGGSVTITTTDGRTFTSTMEAPGGSGPRGIEWSDIDYKYRTLAPLGGMGGAMGGADGAPGVNRLNGQLLPAKCRRELAPGDEITVETPGGGGWGAR